MPNECVIDAHALLWFLEGNPKLGTSARNVMAAADTSFVIPAIALAEACRVAEKGRSTIPSAADLLAVVDRDKRMTVFPIDRDLIWRSAIMTAPQEMHDRLIVATVLRRREQNSAIVLLCNDAEISESKLVPTLW